MPSSPRTPELPPALRALAEAGWALAHQAPSGRIALARAAAVFDFIHYQATPEPLDRATVDRVAQRFDDFDAEPIAVRAAAQTHRGIADGEPVAVRIRRPGLERSVRNDLALLDTLAPALSAALPKADAGALLRAVREQLLDEADFEHEASMHRRVARVLRDLDGLVVPAVRTDLCAEDVFVAELLEGRTVDDGARPKDAERVLVAAHVTAARAGMALLDPRPGHIVALADGRIGLLGVGVARPVDRERVALVLDALMALRDKDEPAFTRATRDVVGTGAYGLAESALGPLMRGRARLDERVAAALALVPRVDPHPDDVWLARSAVQLAATLAASS
jgi:ubiquinone biosynthesis protein